MHKNTAWISQSSPPPSVPCYNGHYSMWHSQNNAQTSRPNRTSKAFGFLNSTIRHADPIKEKHLKGKAKGERGRGGFEPIATVLRLHEGHRRWRSPNARHSYRSMCLSTDVWCPCLKASGPLLRWEDFSPRISSHLVRASFPDEKSISEKGEGLHGPIMLSVGI